MATETLKKAWQNEYVKTATMVILIIAIFSGFWFGSQMALNTQYPALAVASTSMLPTLNVGDLIIVHGVNPDQINAEYVTGDIVVFRSPSNPNKLIVHRAVKVEAVGGGYRFTTHGDNNPSGVEENFHERYLIGKVVARVLYLGNFALLVHVQEGIWFFIILIMILIAIFFAFPSSTDNEEKTTEEEKTQEKRKLFGKLDVEMVYLLILNSLIIGFVVFSLWGAFTFWQLGADPPQHVTIRGMYPDLQYHESFEKSVLSQGLFTYKIDCLVDGAVRPGVPTFSWMQASILILFLFNFKMLLNFVKSRKIVKQEQNLSLNK